MEPNILRMFRQLGSYGTAPAEGCSLFGVGYDEAFERLRQTYLVESFALGASDEKFVYGPPGSGKTHFLRQLMEIGRSMGCVTAEVQVNKNIDFTKTYLVYQELAREIRAPGQAQTGLRALLLDALRRIGEDAEAGSLSSEAAIRAWADRVDEANFKSRGFARVLRRAVDAHLQGDEERFDAAVRWLGGEVQDRGLAKTVGESLVSDAEMLLHAQRSRLALFQFVKLARYRGTIVGFDEAEQGLSVERRRMSRIFSHLLSDLNAVIDLEQGSALAVWAVTPDVVVKIVQETPMLAQRLADPGPDQGFFEGEPKNTLAPRVDLTEREDAVEELTRIGERLTSLFFERVEDADKPREVEAREKVSQFAEEVAATEASSSARRSLVKRVCTALVNSYRSGVVPGSGAPIPAASEPEV